MMKKTFKQLLGLTLGAAMVIGMAGCGNDTPTNNTETQVVSKETETTQTKESETQVVENEEITYPLDSDETITMWTHRLKLNSDYSDPSESPFHTGLSKHVGVNFEFSFPMDGQSTAEGFNLLLTEDVLPDVIFKSSNNTELQELYRDGVIYDLTEYLPTYAPDYWEWLTSDDTLYKSAVTSDGKILAFWPFRENDYSITYSGPIIRQDWLDECGLQSPVTLEDWETVLTAFKEKYNATLGYDAWYFAGEFFSSGTGAYGAGYCAYYVDDNGKIQLNVLQPEWVELMKVMNRWFDAGLIDNDSVTMDTATVRTKAANNQIGATFGPMSMLTNFMTDAESTGSAAKWVGASYPRTAAGEPTSWLQYGTRNIGSAAFITTSCSEEKLITVIKALNYGYSEEGMMYWNFGTEGESYTLNEAGEPEWTDLVLNDPQGLNGAVQRYTGAHAAPIGISMEKYAVMKNNPLAAEAAYTWMENTEVGKHYVSSLELTEEEKLAFTDKHNAISTYVKEMSQKYLMGTESLDKIDEFYAQLEQMRVDECLKIQQAAYERYLAK